MADIFGQEIGKGTVMRYKTDDAVSAASIASIAGFTDKNSNSAFLVDFSASSAERLALMPCFGDKTYIFAYGHDLSVSRSSCTVLVFLGTNNCKPGDNSAALGEYISYYKDNRLSETGTPCSFSLGGNGGFASGYLVAMQIKAYNPALNAVSVTVTYMSAPPA
jgi:hypothetical protein